MILKALCDLAVEEGLSDDLDFVMRPVRFQVLVDPAGHGSIIDMAVVQPADGGKGPRLVVAPRRIPRQEVRASGDFSHFLVDKCDYVFGCNPTAAPGIAQKLSRRASLFKDHVDQLVASLAETSEARRAGLAILRFLGDENARRGTFLTKWEEYGRDGDADVLAKAQFELVFEPLSPAPLHELPEVRAYWKGLRAESAGETTRWAVCLVTGRAGVAVDKHPTVVGVPKTLSSRSSLVSFNSEAFESFGLSRNENAPISRDAAESYVNALNWLLARRPTGQNLRLSSDAIVVFWAKGGRTDWVLDGLDGDSPESVRETLQAPHSGRRAALDDPSGFFSVVLSGAQGRCVVRTYVESTVADVAIAMIRYLEDTSIERPYRDGPGNYRLRELVDSLGLQGRQETVVDTELTMRLYLAALCGNRFPNKVLSSAVRRNRSEAAEDEKRSPNKWTRFAARAALLRAALNRNHQMEVSVALDRARTEPAYLLGRLFAVLDRIQYDALGQVNASTVGRYYGAASSTPAAVFPTLLRRNQHHLAKLSKEKAGLAVVREKLLTEVIGGVDGFKGTMSLPEQGLFALGFHHQRQEFFQKKEADQ